MRKEKIITLNDRGRDLTFKIKEMPATRLESWIIRAGLLIAGSGLLGGSNNTTDAGEMLQMAGKTIAEGGITALGKVDYEKAKPLLDELLACCTRVDAGIEQTMTPDIADGIIEDVRTLFALRKEALALNFDFFATAGPSGSATQENKFTASSNPKISVRSRR